MTKARAQKASRLGREGFALPAVLALLVALSLVGSAAAILTSTEVRVAGLYTLSNRASAASSAGLEHAVAHFGASGPDDGWPVAASIGGYDYSVAITRDSFDFGSGVQPVSFEGSSYNGDDDGNAVWILTAVATRGAYRAEQQLRVVNSGTPSLLLMAPIASNSTVRLRGSAKLEGDSESGDECGDRPAVVLTNPNSEVDANGNVTIEGGEEYEDNDPPYVVTETSFQPYSPEDVLNLAAGALDSVQQTGSEFDATHSGDLSGTIYVTDDFGSKGAGSSNIDGSGLLIVHNPLYDPREHDPSHPLYDAVKVSDPAYGPATLGNITGGDFEGVIIADRIDRIAGDVEINGVVVSLSLIDTVQIRGGAEIKFSCDAAQLAVSDATSGLAGVGAVQRLSWRAK